MGAIFPFTTKGGGQCLGALDVCKTPAPPSPSPVPVPYPNTGMCNQAMQTSTKVFVLQKEVLTTKSEIPKSSGDEAGAAGGVVSGSIMDKITFKKGSAVVKVEGQPAIHQTAVTGHNGSNANAPAGVQTDPSQSKVIIAL